METYKLFEVHVSNAKIIEEIEFHPRKPGLKYHQDLSNSCCLSSLASDFHSIGKNKSATSLENLIK